MCGSRQFSLMGRTNRIVSAMPRAFLLPPDIGGGEGGGGGVRGGCEWVERGVDRGVRGWVDGGV